MIYFEMEGLKISLKDKLEREKNQSLLKVIENLEENIKSEIREIKYQNNLLRERMIQIDKTHEERNERIDNLIERLEKVTNKNEVESFEELENDKDFFEQLKDYSSSNSEVNMSNEDFFEKLKNYNTSKEF